MDKLIEYYINQKYEGFRLICEACDWLDSGSVNENKEGKECPRCKATMVMVEEKHVNMQHKKRHWC